ncbi:MAG: hypothetical protein OQL19_03075 [Gammaproteobacteria bacterium]|nr:hypothetical protein [Gammaproteobacteria bacterium]
MRELKIAIVPLQRLGDGVISLVLANNLHQNNYSVTLIHGFMHQINHWFEFDIKPYPNNDELENILENFDIVLMDMCTPLVLSKSEEQQKIISKKYIFYAVGNLNECFINDHSERLTSRLGKEFQPLFASIAQGCRTIKFDKDDSMVDNMKHYCQKTLKLNYVSHRTGIKIPTDIKFQKNNKRVVIAPTSSLEKKNWGRNKFILLARLFKVKGYKPIFAVSMSERQEWEKILNNEFELPEFKSIQLYAEYLYESLGFIGNDSGGGHVASLMGVPVLTIVSSSKKINFRWRPGWGENAVVAPSFTFKFKGHRYWHHFLTIRKVFNQFSYLIEKNAQKSL